MFNEIRTLEAYHFSNPYHELRLYKKIMYSLDISYRIHGDEGTLSLLNQIKALHDKSLTRIKQIKNAGIFKITSDIEFEYALKYILS